MRVGTPQVGHLTDMMGDRDERAPLLSPRLANLRQAEVPILEGEASDGETPRFGPRVLAAQTARLQVRRGSRFSIRLGDKEAEPPGPDGGWGWLVCLAAFYCICVLDGAPYTFGVFLDPLEVEMGGGHSKVSAVGSLMVATYAFTGPVASRMVTRWGTRPVCVLGALISTLGLGLGSFAKSLDHVMVAYSIITGFGFGLMYLPAIVATANHFTKQRSLAIALCLCGAGFGTFTLSPLETYITANHGWRWGFLSLAGLAFICILAGATMGPVARPPSPTSEPPEPRSSTSPGLAARIAGLILDPALYKSPALGLYLLVCLADVVATLSLFIPFHYVPSIAKDRGLTPAEAAMLISATGVFSTVGRILAGFVADRAWLHPISIASLSTVMVLPPLFSLAFCQSFYPFVICTSLYGLLTGCWIAVMSPIFVRILGLELLSPAFSFLTAVRGLATLAGAPLAGALVDQLQDKSASIHLAGAVMLLSSILFIAANLVSARSDNKKLVYSTL